MKTHPRMSFRLPPASARKLMSYCKWFNESGDFLSAALELANLGPKNARFSVNVATSPHLDRVLGMSIMCVWHLAVSNTVIAMDSPRTKKGAAACLKRAQLGWVPGSDSIETADRMLEKIRAIRNNAPKQKVRKQKKLTRAQEFVWLLKHADN